MSKKIKAEINEPLISSESLLSITQNMGKKIKGEDRSITREQLYKGIYGDVEDENLKLPLTSYLPFCLMLYVGEDELEQKAKGLEIPDVPSWIEGNITFAEDNAYRHALAISAATEEDIKSGDFKRAEYILKKFTPDSAKLVHIILTDREKISYGRPDIMKDASLPIDIPYKNFTLFIEDYVPGWFLERCLDHVYGENETSKISELPGISLYEHVVHGGKMSKWFQSKNGRPGDFKMGSALFSEFEKHFINPYSMNFNNFNDRIFKDIYFAVDVEEETQYFFNAVIQQQYVSEYAEEYTYLIYIMLSDIAGEHPVIAKRALRELQEDKEDGPNFKILIELIRTYIVYFSSEANLQLNLKSYRKLQRLTESHKKENKDKETKLQEKELYLSKKENELNGKERSYNSQIEQLKAENERLRKNNLNLCRDLEAAVKEDEAEIIDIPESLCVEEIKEDIPLISDEEAKEKNVVIIGGFQSVQGKLKTMYPNWTYIAAGEGADKLSPQTELVAIFNRHMSHQTFDPCISRCRQWNIPVVYIKWTNIDMITEFIKQQIYINETK